MRLSAGVLAAMRHILYAPFERLFAFTLPQQQLVYLGEVTQSYVQVQLDKRFPTLDFYLTIKD